jgi:hypothetical protein
MRPPASPGVLRPARIPRPGSRGSDRWPGRIDSRWVGWPATLLLFAGAALSLSAEQALRPALLVGWAATYAATGFFAFFYALLFMAGSTWRRLAMLLFVLLLLTGQITLHLDAAQPRELMVHDELVSRSASVEHLTAAAADALVALLLVLHGFWLAFGSRPRFPGQEPSIFAEPEHVPDSDAAVEPSETHETGDGGTQTHPIEPADGTVDSH